MPPCGSACSAYGRSCKPPVASPVLEAQPKFKPGTRLIREWQGRTHEVTVLEQGFQWNGETYRSLSAIARAITGTRWNGHVFFGLKSGNRHSPATIRPALKVPPAHCKAKRPDPSAGRRPWLTAPSVPPKLRCAIYTRKSSEEGLEQEFNSLQAQREACEAFITSQKGEGWQTLPAHYDDGGWSGRDARAASPAAPSGRHSRRPR